MAVPLEKRCVILKCRDTAKYTLALSRHGLAEPVRHWKLCPDHRDLVESFLGNFIRESPKKSDVIAALAGAGENPQG